jgi:F-type H+-transporting ATPase subunit gamma
MANRRLLLKRRKASMNIRKITRTMQLIATARFQAAFNRATSSKPFTQKLAELASDLSRAAGDLGHPLLEGNDAPGAITVVITSTRGLCGAYNANVLRTAVAHLEEQQERGLEAGVQMVGKKGASYFRFLGRPMEQTLDIADPPPYQEVEAVADALMERFSGGEISSAHVAYMRFHSTGVQRPEVIQLLPLTPPAAADGEGQKKDGGPRAEFEFSPAPRELLDELLPTTVRSRLFQCFIDASVSEQVARMVAMKAATDAAEEMIKVLTRQYNRARQTHITMELLDIVGGAEALG